MEGLKSVHVMVAPKVCHFLHHGLHCPSAHFEHPSAVSQYVVRKTPDAHSANHPGAPAGTEKNLGCGGYGIYSNVHG